MRVYWVMQIFFQMLTDFTILKKNLTIVNKQQIHKKSLFFFLSIASWQAHMVSIKFPKFYPCLAGSNFITSIILSFLLGNNKLISFIFKKIPHIILCLHNYSLSFFWVKMVSHGVKKVDQLFKCSFLRHNSILV